MPAPTSRAAKIRTAAVSRCRSHKPALSHWGYKLEPIRAPLHQAPGHRPGDKLLVRLTRRVLQASHLEILGNKHPSVGLCSTYYVNFPFLENKASIDVRKMYIFKYFYAQETELSVSQKTADEIKPNATLVWDSESFRCGMGVDPGGHGPNLFALSTLVHEAEESIGRPPVVLNDQNAYRLTLLDENELDQHYPSEYGSIPQEQAERKGEFTCGLFASLA
ncbi:hypothetical protein PGTUg99_036178 [Puccinia graminis f. sp. tritici]|uniref:Uncharacterized protein n=1 Tax=Puccinia graminis f. sp. tritici TaxID=56615 RepID=A0A5B0S4J2_PUCGR|nr:hypothetical protein PGTUg99_036178 [Puccinia graminis f. sp. tritici]